MFKFTFTFTYLNVCKTVLHTCYSFCQKSLSASLIIGCKLAGIPNFEFDTFRKQKKKAIGSTHNDKDRKNCKYFNKAISE